MNEGVRSNFTVDFSHHDMQLGPEAMSPLLWQFVLSGSTQPEALFSGNYL